MNPFGRRLLALTILAASVPSCAPDDPDYSTVLLQFQAGQGGDLYAGTTQVTVSVIYESCLESFYATNQQLAFDAPEGSKIMEEWKEKLCDLGGGENKTVRCEVTSIVQRFKDTDNDVRNSGMTIVFTIQDEIRNRVVNLGPLPTQKLAKCTDSGGPLVRIQSAVGMAGSSQAWTMGIASSDTRAAVGQAKPIAIFPKT